MSDTGIIVHVGCAVANMRSNKPARSASKGDPFPCWRCGPV